MQNRYTGDIGDFGKLGLLRVLHSAGLSIGVNWYLTPNESNNGDGRHTEYLNKEQYQACDMQLWSELKRIVESGQREINALENGDILQATYYSQPLDFAGKTKAERTKLRSEWHKEALAALANTDIVFVDPDNGLIVPSAMETVKANKYVEPQELADYYSQGSSVIYYQHKARRNDTFYIEQHKRLLSCPDFDGATGIGLKFVTTSQRYYFFIIQPKHKALINEQIQQMMSTAWKEHFRLFSCDKSA